MRVALGFGESPCQLVVSGRVPAGGGPEKKSEVSQNKKESCQRVVFGRCRKKSRVIKDMTKNGVHRFPPRGNKFKSSVLLVLLSAIRATQQSTINNEQLIRKRRRTVTVNGK